MVLSIKVVFFGKEGISADLIAVNEDVGAACWGISVYISPMPLGIIVAGARLLKNKGDGKQKREGPCVGTKGFRAPEACVLLLGATYYGTAVDLWSTGCILAELYAGKPIMPGRTEVSFMLIYFPQDYDGWWWLPGGEGSSCYGLTWWQYSGWWLIMVEQLHKIFKLCGSPSEDYWRKSKLPHATIFKPQQPYRRCVAETFKDFPTPALGPMETLLSIDPADRGSPASALKSETGRNSGPFAKFLLECDIDARYAMSDTPQQNGVAERRNRTLLDMVSASKSVPKTPYELWSGKKPNLHHFHVWGCKAEVRPYNPQSKKLDPKTISGFFVGYCIGSRGSRFYCPSHTTRIIELDRVVYFEDVSSIDERSSVGVVIYFLVLYVDDILLASNDSDLLFETKHMLSTHFDMKDLGEASYVLGIKILRDRANGVLKLSQRAYIEKILKRFNMHNCKSSKAPIVKGDKFLKAQCPQNDDDEIEEMKTIPYSSVVGSLMYAQVCTRPDIAFVVGMLGRYLSNPGSQHWKAAKKVLRYLQGTKDLMLTYQRTSLLDVVGFCDADFAGCIDDKKSTTCYIFMMAGGAVSWKSVKQTLTASSTMEAEYVACYETVAFSKNTRSISRSKHIDVKFYFVKEKVAESLIDIEHMSTKKSTHSRHGLNLGVEGKSSLTRNSRTIKHWRSFLNTRKEQEMAFHGINQVKPLPCDPSSLPKYPHSKEFDAKVRDEEARRDDENASPEVALEFLAKHCQWAVVTLGSNRCLGKCGRERHIDVDMYITHLKLYAHLLHIAVGGCCTVDNCYRVLHCGHHLNGHWKFNYLNVLYLRGSSPALFAELPHSLIPGPATSYLLGDHQQKDNQGVSRKSRFSDLNFISGSFSWASEANLFSAAGGMNKEACSQVESGTNPTAFPSIVSEENLEWEF
ncbi:Retrovirus-related Pol polyprotein from transposon TNT 1-94 [Vitis vinifera]|uniref:Retrovirus-related Pol polyprotein from transposon TNT 1-94 n=1 Tax=Vitis vinifera TaxID=29760 RepID=A0A438DHJ8_VITVI|nr:Retrovirus-related Pol polyprotein from transposon TNT 1-94 [Vitis vinifera]